MKNYNLGRLLIVERHYDVYVNYKIEEFIKNLGSIELIEFSYISVQPSCRVCIIEIKSLIHKNETISLNLRKQLFLFHKGLDSFKWIKDTDQLEFDKLTKHFDIHDADHVCFYVDNKLCWTVSDDLPCRWSFRKI